MAHRKLNSTAIKLVGTGLMLLLLVGSLLGQDSNTPVDTKNNKDKTQRSGARINQTTLGVELTIPLGAAPGRAGNSLPITFNYSSKVWRMETYRVTEAGSSVLRAAPVYGEHSDSGWTSSLQMPYLEESNIEKVNYPPNTSTGSGGGGGSGGGYSCTVNGASCRCSFFGQITCPPLTSTPQTAYPYWLIPKQTLHLSDGSTVELVVQTEPFYYAVGSYPPVFTDYYSIDGSNLTLRMGQDGQPDVVRFPDGSRYEFSYEANAGQRVTRIDRNGNITKFQRNGTFNHGEWVDTMGNVIPIPKAPRSSEAPFSQIAGDADYYVPGLPNQPMKYTFKWRLLVDSFAAAEYTVKSIVFLFNDTNTAGLHNPVVLKEIVTPEGTKYQFGYNEYGEIEKITHPSGSIEQFTYEAIPQFSYPVRMQDNRIEGQGNRGAKEHRINSGDVTAPEMLWQYQIPHDIALRPEAPYRVEITAPDSSKTIRLLHGGPVFGGAANQPPKLPSLLAGKAYDERQYSTAGTLVSRVLTKWSGVNGATVNVNAYPKVDRTTSIRVEGDQALAQSTTLAYDGYLNVTQQTVFDYIALASSTIESATIENITLGTALKTSETTYETAAGYTSRRMVSMPKTSTVRDGGENGAIIAKTETVYDEQSQYYSLDTSYTTTIGYQSPTGTAAILRGNATTSKVWNKDDNTWISTHAQL